MKWLLVYLFFTNGHIESYEIGKFKSLTECFQAREQLGSAVESTNGYFPINSQAICIRIEE
tara:strand:+ start:752 stop:934 length:183 start_codon:yes stop_codon:yes gene_type:complete